MRLPTLKASAVERQFTDCFYGYRKALRTSPGEFSHTENVSLELFPLLSVRPKRGLYKSLTAPGGILGGDRLCYIDSGTLYCDGEATPLTGISPGEKQLLQMGAYVCVFPDALYYNCAKPTDFGSMEAEYSSTGTVEYSPCSLDGAALVCPEPSPEAPESPANAQLWLDCSGGTNVLRRWSEAGGFWVEETNLYTKATFISTGELEGLFSVLDGVRLSGSSLPGFDGSRIIYGLGRDEGGRDYLIFQHMLTEKVTQTEGSVTVERRLPQMDYVCQCQNRLWGCRWGDGVNELYCCALGDFKNWEQYLGLSTDSWRASVGAAGDWTGAVNFLDSPCFFKADGIFRISPGSDGGHRVSQIRCAGIEKGSHRSAVVINGSLFYKSGEGLCLWRGGYPEACGEALGTQRYKNAAAGAVGKLYYLSLEDEDGCRQLFVLDTRRALWIREDSLPVTDFAPVGQELFALAGGRIYALRGSVGEVESFVSWSVRSGIIGYRQPGKKYLSRFSLRLEMEEGAEAELWLRYDSGEDWLLCGSVARRGRGSVLIPVRPRRCDHVEFELRGRGDCRLISIARVLERGSDT